MGIQKYLKDTPDYTAAGTSRYSTDDQNLRFYYLKNVAMAEQNFEYCFSTNFNHTKYHENTYISLINDYNNTEDAKNAKTGITLDSTEVIGSDTYVNLNIDSITSEKLQGGTSFALLFNHGVARNYEDLMICENIDYDKVVLSVIGYNLDNPNDSTEKGYTFNIYFNNGSSFDAPIINMGTPILVRLTKVNDKIVMRPLNFRTSDNVVPELQLYARWYSTPHPTNFNAEYPYLSTTGYSVTNNIISVSPRSIYGMYTTPFNNRAKRWEYRVYHSSSGDTYADYVSVGGTVDDFIKFLNSTGLRYCDTTTYTTYNDQLNNTYMGVMDENGVTDCNERIKGWTNIDKSDLPNAHRTGYDWNVFDPTKPPIPDPTDADDIDDMPLGDINFGTGFVKYYQCTISDLDFVSDALSSQTQYTDLSRNIVSLKSFTMPTSYYIAATTSQNIKIGSLDINRKAPKITISKSDHLIGSYTIDGKFGSAGNPHFLDKSPYTQIELYIPFCGTITLPDTCMYKTIDVHLLADIFTGSCLGVVKCNGNIVAEKSGICGIDVPITSEDNALKSNALISGVLNSVPIAASAVSGVVSKNPVKVLNAVNSAIGNTNNMRVAESANYTRVVGTTGSRTDNALPDTCFIKIYRPIVHIPDNYAHKYGKPCNKNLNLSSCTGFTQCFSPVINGNMTKSEQEKLIDLLSSGVYL